MGDLVNGLSAPGRLTSGEYGVAVGFHPHVDTQDFVDNFLADTQPDAVSLHLDSGHTVNGPFAVVYGI